MCTLTGSRQHGRRRTAGAFLAIALACTFTGCPRDTVADVQLTERLVELEDAMVQLDQENGELVGRIQRIEANLARQDTLLQRMSRMMDEMAYAIERR